MISIQKTKMVGNIVVAKDMMPYALYHAKRLDMDLERLGKNIGYRNIILDNECRVYLFYHDGVMHITIDGGVFNPFQEKIPRPIVNIETASEEETVYPWVDVFSMSASFGTKKFRHTGALNNKYVIEKKRRGTVSVSPALGGFGQYILNPGNTWTDAFYGTQAFGSTKAPNYSKLNRWSIIPVLRDSYGELIDFSGDPYPYPATYNYTDATGAHLENSGPLLPASFASSSSTSYDNSIPPVPGCGQPPGCGECHSFLDTGGSYENILSYTSLWCMPTSGTFEELFYIRDTHTETGGASSTGESYRSFVFEFGGCSQVESWSTIHIVSTSTTVKNHEITINGVVVGSFSTTYEYVGTNDNGSYTNVYSGYIDNLPIAVIDYVHIAGRLHAAILKHTYYSVNVDTGALLRRHEDAYLVWKTATSYGLEKITSCVFTTPYGATMLSGDKLIRGYVTANDSYLAYGYEKTSSAGVTIIKGGSRNLATNAHTTLPSLAINSLTCLNLGQVSNYVEHTI